MSHPHQEVDLRFEPDICPAWQQRLILLLFKAAIQQTPSQVNQNSIWHTDAMNGLKAKTIGDSYLIASQL